VFGSVDAQTLASDLNLDTIGGDRLVASVHHGRIEGRRVRVRDIELTRPGPDPAGRAAARGRLLCPRSKAGPGQLDVDTSVTESKQQADYVPNLTKYAQDKYDLVIGVGFLMQNAIWKVATQFPNVKFAIIESRP
jgi:hypothetical protein